MQKRYREICRFRIFLFKHNIFLQNLCCDTKSKFFAKSKIVRKCSTSTLDVSYCEKCSFPEVGCGTQYSMYALKKNLIHVVSFYDDIKL